MTDALDGVLVVDKPEGVTSHDVVAAVRRRLPRGTKVGHTGTLDPFATGVLPIVIGKATRLSQFLTASHKRYTAHVGFGTATDTADRTGTVVETAPPATCARLEATAIAAALVTFVGTHRQVPPAHSAKKVDGERAYALARRGESVTLAAVEVTAHAVTLASWDAVSHVAEIDLETAAGYYVRSLARDLGEVLGVPAHLAALRRTASGSFGSGAARPLADLLQADLDAWRRWRVPMACLLPEFPAVTLDDAQALAVRQGRPCALRGDQAATSESGAASRVRLLDDAGTLIALARTRPDLPHQLHADIVLELS